MITEQKIKDCLQSHNMASASHEFDEFVRVEKMYLSASQTEDELISLMLQAISCDFEWQPGPDQIKMFVEFVEANRDSSQIIFNGYTDIVAKDAKEYAWLFSSSMIFEGLSGDVALDECQRVADLFHELGYITNETYNEFLADSAENAAEAEIS